ncbi:MAG: MBL fold metallo-hydrolase [Lentisphaerae bacterium]|nr:MBL fold metallo-hydrolase [Lentisphaerota bacterium]
MTVRTIAVGDFLANCLVAWKNAQALVIDPGDEPRRIIELLDAEKLTVACYLLTHGHADHAMALAELARARPAPVALHAADAAWAFERPNPVLPFHPSPARPDAIARLLRGGEEFTDAGMRWTAIHTPGHTPGSVCYHLPDEGLLFTGDTLFAGSAGRTDLPGGDAAALAASLRKLAGLPDATRLHCGHGPRTTLGAEKRDNPYVRAALARR